MFRVVREPTDDRLAWLTTCRATFVDDWGKPELVTLELCQIDDSGTLHRVGLTKKEARRLRDFLVNALREEEEGS